MALTKVTTHVIADDIALGGNPTTTTQSTGNDTTRIATTAFVQTELASLVDSAPSTLNTLNELAAALGDDANFSTTVTNSIAAKLPLAGGTMTGALNMGSQNITAANRITLADGVVDSGQAGSSTVFNDDGTTADFRIESDSNTHMFFLDGGLNRIGVNTSGPNGVLHIGSSAAVGDASNPAIQIGGTTTYRGGLYTTTEGFIIDNNNGDDGIQLHTKTAGEAVRITSDGNLELKAKTTSFVSPGFTYHTNNYLYLRGGSAGTIISDDSGINTVQIIDGSSGYINFETGDGTSRMRIKHDGKVGIGTTSPSSMLQVIGNIQSADGSGGSATFSSTGSIELKRSGGSFIDFATSTSEDFDCRIKQDSDGLRFTTGGNGSTALGMTIDSSQQVGIGTSSPSATLDVRGGSAGGTHTHAIFTGTTGRGLALKSGQTGGQHNGKAIIDAQDTESGGASMDFQIGGNTKLAIDNSGNVLIGATSTNFGAFSNNTSPQLLVAGTMPQVALHETDTDKDGYIGIAGSTMFIQTADAIPIRFGTSDTERMRILSGGGLTFNGDTAAANALDDYEEGDFTPIFATAGGSAPTSQTGTGQYTKIGDVVHFTGQIAWSGSGSGGSNLRIALPFTPISDARGGISIGLNSGVSYTSGHQLHLIPELNSAVIYVVSSPSDGSAHDHLNFSNVTSAFQHTAHIRILHHKNKNIPSGF